MKFMVGAPPIEGERGHSAALMKEDRSSLESTWDCTPGLAYNWTWVSMVKLCMGLSMSSIGRMYSSIADSISQVWGVGPSVKSEKVKW